MNISKELFEAVTGFKTDYNYVEEQDISDGIFFNELNEELPHNDFFFKCKEWALKNGFELRSWTTEGVGKCESFRVGTPMRIHEIRHTSKTEQQAVINMCEDILSFL